EIIPKLVMASRPKHLYEFGTYRLDVAERLLLHDGQPVELTAKVFDLLVLMVENQGKLLEKSFLLENLWPESFVDEVNLSVNMSALRKALGESPSDPQYIETVPKRGYRFIGAVTTQTDTDLQLAHAAPSPQTPDASPQTSPPLPGPEPAVDQKPIVPGVETASRPFLGPQLLAISGSIIVVILLVVGYLLLRSQPNANTAGASTRTIAVLPFKTLTTTDSDQALGLGMADALITRLGNLQQVIVRPTSTVLKYSDGGKDPLLAGRELGVEAVLDGRVQRDDKKVRVTAQLLRVQDGSTLWSGKFDDFFTNLFALQDSISEKMAEALSMRLTRDEQKLIGKRNTENTEAYQLYTQGRYAYFKYEFDKAMKFLEAAVEKDPEYAMAYATLAVDYLALATKTSDRQGMRDKAMTAAKKALSLEPNLDEAHNAMGWVKFLGDWDWPGAEESLRRATELNPNNADAHTNLGSLLICIGRTDEGLKESELAMKLDPVSSDANLNYAYNLLESRRYHQALEQGQRMADLDPHHSQLGLVLARIYIANSMFQQAIDTIQQHYGTDEKRLGAVLAVAYVALGRRTEAEAALQDALKIAGRPGGSYSIAMVYAALNDNEHALDWLEKAYEARDNPMLHLKMDPTWDNLRDDPRFLALLRRMRL